MRFKVAVAVCLVVAATACSSSSDAQPSGTIRPTTTEVPGLPRSLQGIWSTPSGYAIRFVNDKWSDGEIDADGSFVIDNGSCQGTFELSDINSDRTYADFQGTGSFGSFDTPCNPTGSVDIDGDELTLVTAGEPTVFTRFRGMPGQDKD